MAESYGGCAGAVAWGEGVTRHTTLMSVDFLSYVSIIAFRVLPWMGLMEVNGLDRTTRRDSIAREDSDAESLNGFGEFDPWTAWAYKPRTISLLLIGACLLV
ncbi:hypothetical protein BHE74_00001536 [Ensete ventricosum]|nr:hypothetical protein BHE74_00001536 [Ensete ventricosum]RZR77502.1 hypothetical protein BHM03_00002614 [Ensete ventricosum]